jgi:hypothetical protein
MTERRSLTDLSKCRSVSPPHVPWHWGECTSVRIGGTKGPRRNQFFSPGEKDVVRLFFAMLHGIDYNKASPLAACGIVASSPSLSCESHLSSTCTSAVSAVRTSIRDLAHAAGRRTLRQPYEASRLCLITARRALWRLLSTRHSSTHQENVVCIQHWLFATHITLDLTIKQVFANKLCNHELRRHKQQE